VGMMEGSIKGILFSECCPTHRRYKRQHTKLENDNTTKE
jgi:hypothetical protein